MRASARAGSAAKTTAAVTTVPPEPAPDSRKLYSEPTPEQLIERVEHATPSAQKLGILNREVQWAIDDCEREIERAKTVCRGRPVNPTMREREALDEIDHATLRATELRKQLLPFRPRERRAFVLECLQHRERFDVEWESIRPELNQLRTYGQASALDPAGYDRFAELRDWRDAYTRLCTMRLNAMREEILTLVPERFATALNAHRAAVAALGSLMDEQAIGSAIAGKLSPILAELQARMEKLEAGAPSASWEELEQLASA